MTMPSRVATAPWDGLPNKLQVIDVQTTPNPDLKEFESFLRGAGSGPEVMLSFWA